MSESNPRPAALTLTMWFMGFWAGACLLTLVSVWLGNGPIMIDGTPTARQEVLDLLMPMLLPLGLGAGAAALTIWIESPWARPTLLFALLLAGPFATFPQWNEATNPGGAPALGLLATTPLLLLAWWYLYLKPNVVAYFREVSRRRYAPPDARDPAAGAADREPDREPAPRAEEPGRG
ncbi:MAG TPA: hypothetical protein VK966_11240 [Longimicrobiales bacterium]|nr:hypothetical protein [Longimicrobiales bacterium]